MNGRTLKNAIQLVLGTGMFIYIVLRAYYLSFTHDESLTYTIIMGDEFYKGLPNNHVLNTALVSFSYILFGSNELALRLPNVLAYILYFSACYCFLKPQENIVLSVFGAAVLLFNPFLIDFFSLCRGYGLSMGFLMASLYFLLDQISRPPSQYAFLRNLALSLIFAGLALYSNLVLINYYLICIMLNSAIYLLCVRKNIEFSKNSKLIGIAILISALLPFVHSARHLLSMSKSGQLFVGEGTLFESMESLTTASLYRVEYPSWLSGLLAYAAISSILLGMASIVVKRDFIGRFALITSVLVALIGAIVAENWFFSAKYPSGRTALYFVPVYGLFVYYFALHVSEFYSPPRNLFTTIIIAACVIMAVHFITTVNLKYTKEWFYDANTKNVMKFIEENSKNLPREASISNHWLFEPSINYYINSRKLKLNPANRDGVNSSSDFIYRLDDHSVLDHYAVIADYKDTNASLLVKN